MTKAKLEYSFLLISVVIFFLGLGYGIIKNNHTKVKVLLFSLFASVFVFWSLFYLVADDLSGNGIDEAVFFHLNYGLAGGVFVEFLPIILTTIFLTILGLFLPYIIINKLDKIFISSKQGVAWVTYVLMVLAFVYHPASRAFYKHFDTSVYQTSSRSEGQNPKLNKMRENDFNKFYKIPTMLQPSNNKLNLIYIYAEGFERTYFNQKVFPDLIKDLGELEKISHSFINIKQAPGTSWTMAGMVSSQCGIPLVTPGGFLNANSMANMDLFLPGAVCIGDLLVNNGYSLSFFKSTPLKFAGADKFYRTHGFTDIVGRDRLQKELTTKFGEYDWGFEDDDLFEFAFKKISHLKQPFAFYTLTTGTHSPGRVSKNCSEAYQDGSNKMLNAVKCSDKTIAEFVNKILKSKYAKNTVIVIASDHLAMGHHIVRDLTAKKLRSSVRRNLFLVISPKIEPKTIAKVGSMLDVSSTLLNYLGFNGEIGLGRDLLSKEKSILNYNKYGWNRQIKSFWEMPKLNPRDKITITQASNSVSFNKRSFNYPLLLTIDENKEVEMLFKSSTARKNGNGIIANRLSNLKDYPFLWVDKCKSMRPVFLSLYKSDCVMYGKSNSKDIVFSEIKNSLIISVDDIF